MTTWLQRLLAGQSPVAERECLPPEDRAGAVGVRAAAVGGRGARLVLVQRSGYEIDDLVGEPLAQFVTAGLLDDDGRRVRLTRAGLLVSDSIWPHFLQSSERDGRASLATAECFDRRRGELRLERRGRGHRIRAGSSFRRGILIQRQGAWWNRTASA